MFKDLKIMKTNIIANNTIMNNVVKYLCAVLILLGTSASAWGATCDLYYWDKSSSSYVKWKTIDESFEFPPYDQAPYFGTTFITAWTPTTYNSSSYPSSNDYYYTGQTYGSNGNNTTPPTLYAVYSYSGSYTSAPDIQIIDPEACTDPITTAPLSSKTVNYGSGTFSLTAGRTGGGAVTWRTSDASVATVSGNATSATVTVVGAGTATITYAVAKSGDYCASEATCEVTVNAIPPTLSHNTAGKVLATNTIKSTSVKVAGGIITNKGGAAITRYGFVLGTSADVEFNTSGAKKKYSQSDPGLNTAFGEKEFTDLSPETTYYIRAFAYNGTTYGYSTAISFTTLAQYTISYDPNGGSGTVGAQAVDAGGSVTVKAVTGFTKTGYTFTGWKLDNASSGTAYSAGDTYSSITANHTFYAQWAPANYTVSLNNQSATDAGTTSIEVTYNASTNLTGTPAITVPTKTGYTFGGYYTGIGGEGEQIIAANGNVNADVDDFTDGSKNWIYANGITLYAKWTANTIDLTLSRNGVTGTDGSGSVNYDATVLTSRTDATNSAGDYRLVGYYAEVGTTTKVLESNGNFAADNVSGYITDGKWSRTDNPTTLFAKWSMSVYTVTFNMHGHGTMGSQEVESGTIIAEPEDPVVEDWRFLGWYEDDGGEIGDDEFDFSVGITANTTIHAKWEAISYSSVYKAWCEPDIDITGDIHLTTVNGIAVYATSTTNNLLRVQSDDLAGVNKLEIKYLDADNADAEVAKGSSPFRLCNDGSSNYDEADGSEIDVSASNTCDLSYSISYTPSDYNLKQHYKLQIVMKHNDDVLKTVTKDIYGRSLPEEFVVASKFGGEWYALPNTLEATQEAAKAVAGIKISVDNTETPTKATYAPITTVYQGENRYLAAHKYAIRLTNGTGHLQVSTTNNVNKMWLSSTGSTNCQDWWLSSTDFGYYSVTIPSNAGNESKKIGMSGGNIGYYGSPTDPSGQIYFLPIEHKLIDNPASVTEWGQKSVILDVDAQASKGIVGAQARIGNGAAEVATSFGQTRTSVKDAASKYNYTVSFTTTDFSTHKGELLYIDWLDGENEVVSTSMVEIPWIIASNSVMGEIDNVQAHWKDWEVHVLPGKTLEADGNSFSAASNTAKIKTLEIYPGAIVKVTSGTLDVTNLVMRYGWTRAGEKAYDVAQLRIKQGESGANLTTTNVYADWYIDYDQYYPIAVPWKVATATGISYKNSNSSASAGVKIRYYDGALRATNGQQNQDANWVEYNWNEKDPEKPTMMPANLEPSKGYAMTAKRPAGKAFSIVRMQMTIPSSSWTALGEHGEISGTHKDQVSVTGWGKGTADWYAMGWNFIGNPYMSVFNGNDDGIAGAIEYQNGGEVRYATIPDLEFKNYDQVPIADANLKPASAFFIQANNLTPQNVTFNASKIAAPSAPARYTTNDETVPEQEAYIRLSHEGGRDQMGLIIGEDYTDAYEPNADLAKMLGEANAVKTYMRYGEMDMAYVAINQTLAKQWIPVTVKIPADGEYTYSLTRSSTVDALEGIYLIDYGNGDKITNLLEETYQFEAEAGTISGRFAINAIFGERPVPTDIDIVGGDINGSEPIKFLYHDKVFILHNGVIYDATGKKVREINK